MNDILMELAKAIPYAVLAYFFTKTAYKDIDRTRNSIIDLHKETVANLKELATIKLVDVKSKGTTQADEINIEMQPVTAKEWCYELHIQFADL